MHCPPGLSGRCRWGWVEGGCPRSRGRGGGGRGGRVLQLSSLPPGFPDTPLSLTHPRSALLDGSSWHRSCRTGLSEKLLGRVLLWL